MKQQGYEPRTYRHWIEGKDLIAFNVTAKETDLYIRASSNLQRKAQRLVLKYRQQVEKYIQKNPEFQSSLKPLPVLSNTPHIVLDMLKAGQKANVGPMAAIAGAIAEHVGKELLESSPEIIIENGGDIFLKLTKKRIIGIYAGDSPLTGKLGLEITPQETPLGICTSSATVGHSLSFGKADAVVAISGSTSLADAAATAICNQVKSPKDVGGAIEFGQTIDGLKGIVIIIGTDIGVWGDVKLCQTGNKNPTA